MTAKKNIIDVQAIVVCNALKDNDKQTQIIAKLIGKLIIVPSMVSSSFFSSSLDFLVQLDFLYTIV